MSVSLLLLTLAYTFHIVEEYHFNWLTWAQNISHLELKWTEFFIVNACVMVFGITCTILGYSYPMISYTFAGLSIINAVFAHIGVTILKHKFSPGLITSILLFLPLSVWAYIDALEKQVMTVNLVIATILQGAIIMCIPIGIQIIKNRVISNRKLRR